MYFLLLIIKMISQINIIFKQTMSLLLGNFSQDSFNCSYELIINKELLVLLKYKGNGGAVTVSEQSANENTDVWKSIESEFAEKDDTK